MKQVLRQDVHLSNGTVIQTYPEQTLPGLYAYIKHDQETSFYYRPRDARGNWGYNVPRMLVSDRDHLDNTDGFPEAVPMSPRDGIRLTEELQWFIVGQFCWSRYWIDILEKELPGGRVVTVKEQFHSKLNRTQQDFLKEAFRQCFRDDTAFSNHSGIFNKKTGEWTGKSFIHDTGGPDLPRMWELSCGGSTHKVASTTVTEDMEFIELVALKPSDYRTFRQHKFDDPRYRHEFFFAVNSTPFKVGTRDTLTNTPPWKADEMHFLGGAHVPLPFMSIHGKVKVARVRVQTLRDMREFRYPYIK